MKSKRRKEKKKSSSGDAKRSQPLMKKIIMDMQLSHGLTTTFPRWKTAGAEPKSPLWRIILSYLRFPLPFTPGVGQNNTALYSSSAPREIRSLQCLPSRFIQRSLFYSSDSDVRNVLSNLFNNELLLLDSCLIVL